MEKTNEFAGMKVESDEDLEHDKSSPRLLVLSTPPWGFHSEPLGMATPPLNNFSSSVPFQWEEAPGKPKHQQKVYCSTSPVSNWNNYQESYVEKPKTQRAKRGISVSFNLLDCMTCKTHQLENYDFKASEYKGDDSAFRVIDGVVDAYAACPCPTFPTPTLFVTRRKRSGWVVRKLCKSSSFFVSMGRRAKCVVR